MADRVPIFKGGMIGNGDMMLAILLSGEPDMISGLSGYHVTIGL